MSSAVSFASEGSELAARPDTAASPTTHPARTAQSTRPPRDLIAGAPSAGPGRPPQLGDRRRAIARAEDGRTRHEDVGARPRRLPDRLGADAPIDLERHVEAALVDPAPDLLDLAE